MQQDYARFDRRDIENVLSKLPPDEIDKLAFGAIELDAAGTVLTFNRYESQITGRRPEDVIGKNFFREIAPCTNRPEFYGRFVEGVKSGQLDVMFDYVFDHKMSPTRVRVYMTAARRSGRFWILVRRQEDWSPGARGAG